MDYLGVYGDEKHKDFCLIKAYVNFLSVIRAQITSPKNYLSPFFFMVFTNIIST